MPDAGCRMSDAGYAVHGARRARRNGRLHWSVWQSSTEWRCEAGVFETEGQWQTDLDTTRCSTAAADAAV